MGVNKEKDSQQATETSIDVDEEVHYQEGRSALIIGMGLFGSAVARELTRLGWFVLAVDGDQSKLNNLRHEVSAVRVIDAIDLEVIQSLDPSHYDVCISAIGDENAHVITTTIHNLKQSGAQTVIARTTNSDHNEMFTKLGCDLLIQPEGSYGIEFSQYLHRHSAQALADQLKSPSISYAKLQKHNLALNKAKKEEDQTELSVVNGGSLVSTIFQILLWGFLLQYTHSLSVELDRLAALSGQENQTSYSHTFNILSISLIIIWLFTGKIFKLLRTSNVDKDQV